MMHINEIIKSCSTVRAFDGKDWHPARPQTAENTFLVHRINAAWRVLTGKSDAVEWTLKAQAGKGLTP